MEPFLKTSRASLTDAQIDFSNKLLNKIFVVKLQEDGWVKSGIFPSYGSTLIIYRADESYLIYTLKLNKSGVPIINWVTTKNPINFYRPSLGGMAVQSEAKMYSESMEDFFARIIGEIRLK